MATGFPLSAEKTFDDPQPHTDAYCSYRGNLLDTPSELAIFSKVLCARTVLLEHAPCHIHIKALPNNEQDNSAHSGKHVVDISKKATLAQRL
eukprot:5469656-Amphidinium_carterae.2